MSGIFVTTIGGQSPPIATETVRLTVKSPSLRDRTRLWTVPLRTHGYVSVSRWPETNACVGSEAPTTRSEDGVSGSLIYGSRLKENGASNRTRRSGITAQTGGASTRRTVTRIVSSAMAPVGSVARNDTSSCPHQSDGAWMSTLRFARIAMIRWVYPVE